MRATREGLLPLRPEVRLGEVLVRPALLAAQVAQLAPGSETASLTVGMYRERGCDVSGCVGLVRSLQKKKKLVGREKRANPKEKRTLPKIDPATRGTASRGSGCDDVRHAISRSTLSRERSSPRRSAHTGPGALVPNPGLFHPQHLPQK
jgi:hypothetical protein